MNINIERNRVVQVPFMQRTSNPCFFKNFTDSRFWGCFAILHMSPRLQPQPQKRVFDKEDVLLGNDDSASSDVTRICFPMKDF